jgi:hypothetical protein
VTHGYRHTRRTRRPLASPLARPLASSLARPLATPLARPLASPPPPKQQVCCLPVVQFRSLPHHRPLHFIFFYLYQSEHVLHRAYGTFVARPLSYYIAHLRLQNVCVNGNRRYAGILHRSFEHVLGRAYGAPDTRPLSLSVAHLRFLRLQDVCVTGNTVTWASCTVVSSMF